MDSNRFDEMTRSLATGLSRRRVLGAFTAVIAAAGAGLFGRADAEAKYVCRVKGKVCRKPGDCCTHFCGPKDSHGRQYCDTCPAGGSPCGNGLCCDEGSTCLDGACCPNACGRGDDLVCCGADEGCYLEFDPQNQTTTGLCCPADQDVCNDGTDCCAAGDSCINGGCCAAADICGNNCCLEGQTCDDGECFGVIG